MLLGMKTPLVAIMAVWLAALLPVSGFAQPRTRSYSLNKGEERSVSGPWWNINRKTCGLHSEPQVTIVHQPSLGTLRIVPIPQSLADQYPQCPQLTAPVISIMYNAGQTAGLDSFEVDVHFDPPIRAGSVISNKIEVTIKDQ